jgi:aminodeoxyfutalosine synthase
MTTTTHFDDLMSRIAAGERLSLREIRDLAAAPDILPIGMLADALKRRLHGQRVTFLRVSVSRLDGTMAPSVDSASQELRLTGTPESLTAAVQAVAAARSAAGARTLAAFTWNDVERVAGSDLTGALEQLRSAGLDAVAELPLDAVADAAAALDQLTVAGFRQARLTIDKGHSDDRVALLIHAGELRDRFSIVKVFNPLPLALNAFRPTTGYEDVKTVALARLAAPTMPAIQLDWLRYGPKLAQVGLSFGADDIDGVSGSDEAPDGRRRAALEEIRRNIEAAGFEPVERDGRFAVPA